MLLIFLFRPKINLFKILFLTFDFQLSTLSMFSFFRAQQFYYLVYFIILVWATAFTFNMNQFEPLFYFDAHRDDILNFYFRWITEFGDIYPYLFFATIFLIQKKRIEVFKIALVGFITILVSLILKNVFSHIRPGTILDQSHFMTAFHWVKNYPILKGTNSFPSGHATSAFAIWSMLAFTQPRNILFGMCCLFIACSVCVSRIYLCAHFPQDVIAGSFVGLWIATCVEFIFLNRTSNEFN